MLDCDPIEYDLLTRFDVVVFLDFFDEAVQVFVVWLRFKFQLTHVFHKFDHLRRAVLTQLLDGYLCLFLENFGVVLLLGTSLDLQMLEIFGVFHIDLMHFRLCDVPWQSTAVKKEYNYIAEGFEIIAPSMLRTLMRLNRQVLNSAYELAFILIFNMFTCLWVKIPL